MTAPDFPLESLLAQLLRPSIHQVLEALTQISTNCSVEQIHQTRVSIRTLRAYLDTFGSLLCKSETRVFSKQLQWLNSILGPLRDADVTLGLLTKDLNQAASSGHRAEELKLHLMRELAEEREAQVATLPELLGGRTALSLTSALSDWLIALPMRGKVLALSSQNQQVLISQCLEQSRQKLYRLATQASRRPSRARLHGVRIQAKKVQYSFATAQALGVVKDTETISLAGELHKLLGRYQDLSILATWLNAQELASDKHLHIKRIWMLETKQQRNKTIGQYQALMKKGLT